MLRVDREVRTPLDPSLADQLVETVLATLSDHQAVLVSDYAKGVCTPEVLSRVIRAARDAEIPVIVDEGCWTPQDAVEVVKRASADVISIYFTKAGGLIRSMEIGAVAHAAGLPVNVNGSLEAGVGRYVREHLATDDPYR